MNISRQRRSAQLGLSVSKDGRRRLSVHVAIISSFGLLLVACCWVTKADEKYLGHDPANGPRPPFSEIYDTVENRALERLMYEDTGRITIRQVTLFQRRLLDRCMDVLPDGVELQYNGPLRDSRLRGLRIAGDNRVMHSLSWHVVKDVVIFGFWLSTERTNTSILDLKIDGRRLFVNIDGVDDDQSVDKKLPQLGDRSVRDVLSLLKTKGGEDDARNDKRRKKATGKRR